MAILRENPLDCEVGEAYLHRDNIEVPGWEVIKDVTGCTVYCLFNPDAGNLETRHFQEAETLVDGIPTQVMLRIDSDAHLEAGRAPSCSKATLSDH